MRIPWRLVLLKRRLLHRWEGEHILRETYRQYQGKELDYEHPGTFTAKLFRRMIHVHRHRNATFTRLADKFLVREHVAERIGERYLIKLLWQGTDPRQIPFDTLPDRCVIKTNHGSGGNIICQRPADPEAILKELRKWMREDHYLANREYHYYHIRRRIIIEDFIDDRMPDGPLDYRFWCFHGKPEVIQVDNHRHSINPFYDTQWNLLPVRYRKQVADADIPKPANFDEMLSLAERLSAEFDFVRVDLYNVQGRIYFGELTFTPVAGQFTFDPPEFDLELGRKWTLPKDA